MSTGSVIRRLRNECGLTQKQLGELLGVTDKAVSKWEGDKGGVPLAMLTRLAEVFGVGIDVFLAQEGRGERKFPPQRPVIGKAEGIAAATATLGWLTAVVLTAIAGAEAGERPSVVQAIAACALGGGTAIVFAVVASLRCEVPWRDGSGKIRSLNRTVSTVSTMQAVYRVVGNMYVRMYCIMQVAVLFAVVTALVGWLGWARLAIVCGLETVAMLLPYGLAARRAGRLIRSE